MAAHRPDVKADTPLEVQHITAECRTNRSLYPAWYAAVSELYEVYSAQVERYPDATISLAVYRTDPEPPLQPDPDPDDVAWLDAGYAPETAIAKVTNEVQVDGDTAYLPNGQVLQGVHPATACEGRGCPIHHPTDHAMAGWPLLWRGDRGLMERVCLCRIGHPDVDHMAWYATCHTDEDTRAEGVHGCCGCELPKAA